MIGNTVLRIYRTERRGPLFYSLVKANTSQTHLHDGYIRFRTILSRSTSPPIASLETALVRLAWGSGAMDTITFHHPADISTTDIQSILSDAAYENRSACIGYGGIMAACLWSAWAMPNGGWFVLLFKQVALPMFGVYGGARCLDTHLAAKSAERIDQLIRGGSAQFKVIDSIEVP